MGWCIVVVKDPVCGNVWMNPYDFLYESFKKVFVVILVDCLSSGNPLFLNSTHGIKETHKHAFRFNSKEDGIPLRDITCFHFRDEVRKHVLTRQTPTPQLVTAKPCHCKSG